ncbi:HD domain-containing protein [Candidatus Parvarchaeota archaeon]|nr:HD domain-containing protein [Candidatus Parvarchaeota archaeon]
MASIKDCIHGMIRISDFEQQVIDTQDFQRLRGIKQMACAYLVYPGAMHTRFEHSLGAMHLAGSFAASLGLSKDETEKLRLSALLHDIGHIAFSHEGEAVFEAYLGDHEKIGLEKIRRGQVADIVSSRYSRREIEALFLGKSHGQVIDSDVGCDRMDYLLRDSYHTGVAYGIIDSQRIISQVKFSSRKLCVMEGGLEATESLLIARFQMFSTVYCHKTARIAAAMLQKAIRIAVETGEFEPRLALEMGDWELLQALGASGGRGLVERLWSRRLYKQAYAIGASGKNSAVQGEAKSGELEEKLARACGCDVIVDYPAYFHKAATIRIETEGGLEHIERVSAIVSSLEKAAGSRQNIIVCCREEDKKKVNVAARKLLG